MKKIFNFLKSTRDSGELLKDEPLGQKLLKKSFWAYFFTYLAAPSGYLVRVLISRTVSVEDVGVLYSIIGFVSLISIYNDLGLTESLKYFIPRFWVKKQLNYIKTTVFLSLGVQLLTALGIIVFLWFGAPWLAEHYFDSEASFQILRYFCFYFLGINLFQVLQSIFISFQDIFNLHLMNFVKMWAIVIFTWSFFLLGYGDVVHYSIAWIGSIFVAIVLGLILFAKKYRKKLFSGKLVFEKIMLKKYFKYALWAFLGSNASMLLVQIDQQMVISLISKEMAGYYANFMSLFLLINFVVGPFLGFLFPVISELRAKKQEEKLLVLQNLLLSYMVVLGIFFGALFVVLGPELAVILFGKKFMFSGQLLSFVGGFVFINLLIGVVFSTLAGIGKIKERVKIIAVAGVLNIVMNLVFMRFWGIYGIVLSTILGWVFIVSVGFIVLNKEYKIKFQWKLILKNLLLVIVLASLIYLIKDFVFVMDDLYKGQNFLWILLIGVVYFGIIASVNYKNILSLIDEVKN